MNKLIIKLKKQDFILLSLILILSILGLLSIYSASINATTLALGKGSFERQVVFIIIGFSIYFIIILLDYNWLNYKVVWISIFIINLILMIALLIWGQEINNVKRWIQIGTFQLQPAELSKLTIIIIGSALLSSNSENITNIRIKRNTIFISILNKIKNNLKIIIFFIFSFIFIILTFIQPSAGNACIIFLLASIIFTVTFSNQVKVFTILLILFLSSNIFFKFIKLDFIYSVFNFSEVYIGTIDLLTLILSMIAIFFITLLSKIKISTLFIALIIGFSIFPIFSITWNSTILKPYMKLKIISFFDSSTDINKTGSLFQIEQARIAIGSGGIWGKGYLQGTQTKLGYLPFAHTDFAYAGFAEEFGFIGSVIILLLYIFLILRILNIAKTANDLFGKILSYGIAILLILHIWVSISVNLGNIVNTGIPLPFLSYGGSFTLVLFTSFGLVQSIAILRNSNVIDRESDLMLTSKGPWRTE